MFEFPTYIKVKSYRKNRKSNQSNSWIIGNKYKYIRSKYVISFHPWTDPRDDQDYPSWVIKWLSPDKKEAKYYLVDDPQYKSYFNQYKVLSDPNSLDHLFTGFSLN